MRIADWHTGALSSYEMLELLRHADNDGAFKTALHNGEPSQHRKAVLQIANELAVIRSIQAPDLDGDLWGSQFFFTEAKLRELSSTNEVRAGGRDAVMSIGAINPNDS